MATVTAGNTSASVQVSDENAIVVIDPAASSTGYAEVSYDESTWTKWRPGDVLSRAEIKAGSGSPFYRAVCLTGSLQFIITFGQDRNADTARDHAINHAQMGAYDVLTLDDTHDLPETWIEDGIACSATYNVDGTVNTITKNGITRSCTYDDGVLVSVT